MCVLHSTEYFDNLDLHAVPSFMYIEYSYYMWCTRVYVICTLLETFKFVYIYSILTAILNQAAYACQFNLVDYTPRLGNFVPLSEE